jgi:hypothetical protein
LYGQAQFELSADELVAITAGLGPTGVTFDTVFMTITNAVKAEFYAEESPNGDRACLLLTQPSFSGVLRTPTTSFPVYERIFFTVESA